MGDGAHPTQQGSPGWQHFTAGLQQVAIGAQHWGAGAQHWGLQQDDAALTKLTVRIAEPRCVMGRQEKGWYEAAHSQLFSPPNRTIESACAAELKLDIEITTAQNLIDFMAPEALL